MKCDEVKQALVRTVRDVPDFPKPGVLFKDITPVLLDPVLFGRAVTCLVEYYEDKGVTVVISPEARGFILGSVLAQRLGVGFVPARKPGKLPYHVQAQRYSLEYGEDEIQVHRDAITSTDKVVVCDDVVATGGTAAATCQLVESLGATVVGACFLIELVSLGGKEKLAQYDVFSLIST